jgi:hypothetical protein
MTNAWCSAVACTTTAYACAVGWRHCCCLVSGDTVLLQLPPHLLHGADVNGCQPPTGDPCANCDTTANPGAVASTCEGNPNAEPLFHMHVFHWEQLGCRY